MKTKHCIILGAIIISSILAESSANVEVPTEIFNKTDLEPADSNAKIVGVKKHKNYEIVVYEYDESDEPDGKKPDAVSGSSTSSPLEEVDDNSVELPALDHPTPPAKLPKRTSKASTTTTTPAASIEEDPLEAAGSQEDSVSVESDEESSEVTPPKVTPSIQTSVSHSVSRKTSSVSTSTSRPRLPKPFRSTEAPTSKKRVESEEDEESGSFSDEDDSSSFDDYYYGRRKTNEKKKQPKPFGGKDEEDYEDSFEDDYDESNKKVSSARKPLRRPSGSGRVTPKPYFPLIYDEAGDEYEDDDNEAGSSTTKKPTRRVTNPIRAQRKKKNETEVATDETDDLWGLDKSLKCEDPNGRDGVCQEYSRCSIFYQELMDDYDEPIDPAEYKCRLPTQVGICCPLVSENDVVPERKLIPGFLYLLYYCYAIMCLVYEKTVKDFFVLTNYSRA